ncbi:outer membrane protein with beta-barrel domain [Flavobacterium sp. 90]|uniref:outer membrane beta-barrel protein n=1 Tax=unclassified Flavobacterium TaxID=196869 RepID=UPI000EB118D4|nr:MULTISPECIES: outer membrane beta-barrel protein [unclassified Flavobacterium]RKR10460.1 outer membrane protein with beta-barrel domain [Flavobacterium sp. 81]TCK54245.1 outer membrane protein with beta-barrel domain [Flavobacterium sp. 90]
MKLKITTVLALFVFAFGNAQQQQIEQELSSSKGVQFEKGDMFIEGSITINTGGTSDYYGFSPKFGYLINDKIAVGAKLNYSSDKVEIGDKKTDIFSVGVFARHYFLQLDSKRLKAYGEVGLGYGSNKTKTYGVSDTSNSITADINVGLNYFFTKKIAATFTLANILSYNSVSPENGPSSNTFKLNINLFENIFNQPQFGLLYKF